MPQPAADAIARHPRVAYMNAISTTSEIRCYPDAGAAFEDIATYQPYNNTRVATSYCTGGPGCRLIMAAEPADNDARLAELSAELLAMVQQPVAPRGREITRQRWETQLRALTLRAYHLGRQAADAPDQRPGD